MARSTPPWRSRTRPALALTAGLLLGLAALPCLAQDEDVPPAEEVPEAQPAVQPQGVDSVSGRIGRLEEKMQDLQVSIGTLESFLRTKPGTTLPQEAPAPVRAPQADLSPRIDVLETQIGALTSHIEQLTRQMSALEKKLCISAGGDRAAAARRARARAAGRGGAAAICAFLGVRRYAGRG